MCSDKTMGGFDSFSKKHRTLFNRYIIITLIFFCTSLIYTESVNANDSSSYYVGSGLGISFLQAKTDNTTLNIAKNSDSALSLLAGYSYNDSWSGELFWAYLGKSNINSNSTNMAIGNITQQSFGASGTFHFPLSKKWDVIATAGVGILHNNINLLGGSGTKNDTFVQVGLGASWKFAETWELRTKYDYYNKSAQLFSFNIVKHFGKETKIIIPKLVKLKTCDEFFEKFTGVTFSQSSTELNDVAKLKLDSLAINIIQLPNDITFEIRAHADDVGTELFNYQLSAVRAQIVRNYLSKKGIALSRMIAQGYGEWLSEKKTESSLDNENNRRVDIVLVGIEKYVEDISSCH